MTAEDTELDAVMGATRVLVAVIAESMADVEAQVSVAQFRVLVLADPGPITVSDVARALRVHPSNATRTCDRLVESGLLLRRDSRLDRRRAELRTSAGGRRLLADVMARRRQSLSDILSMMTAQERSDTARALEAFAGAAGRLGTTATG